MEANRIPGLDNMQLPDFLFPAFFGDTLVDVHGRQTSASPTSAPLIESLGGNRKRIIFLTADREHKYLDEGLMDFVQGLLGACSLTMQDIVLVNFHQVAAVNHPAIVRELHPEKMVVFGVTPVQLGLPQDFPQFQIEKLGTLSCLFCPPLLDIRNDKELKKRLWGGFQTIFQLTATK